MAWCVVFGAPRATANVITSTQDFQIVARLTGPAGSNSINPTWQVGIGGTDLGHMVNHNGKTYFLFGDTFASEASAGSGGPDWRQNVMAYSTDANPADGISFDGWVTRPDGTANQVIVPGSQPVTYIPTGAISVGDHIYSWYMHVSDWNEWTLSHAGLAKWREGDDQFSIVPGYRFQNPQGGSYTTGHGTQGGNFGMVAASYRSPLENSSDGHIYLWGTPGGREGGVKLARVLPSQIENLSAYRYFDGLAGGIPQWTASEYDGDRLIEGGVGEMSVMYNPAVGGWTLMYITGGPQPDFEIRQAPNPWGPWSSPVKVADFSQAPGLYSPYMNPLYVDDNGETLYFTMSLWNPYDVYIAKATLNLEDRIQWKGSVGTWSNGLNWNLGVPTSVDNVVIGNGGTANVNSLASANRLDVGSSAGPGGRVVISGGGSLIVGDALHVFSGGEVNLAGGALTAVTIRSPGAGSFNFTGGALAVAAFEGNLTNAGGTLAPGGDQAAQTSVFGHYTQLAGAALSIQLGGTILGTQYDALDVTGTLTLEGALAVSLLGGFTPDVGDEFDILDFASLTGAFSSVQLPALPAGLAWDATRLYETGALSVVVGTTYTADFDADGDVDGDDLLKWRADFGMSDGGDDFLVWQRQFGSTVQPAPTRPTPEPGSLAMALLLAPLASWIRRSSHRVSGKATCQGEHLRRRLQSDAVAGALQTSCLTTTHDN